MLFTWKNYSFQKELKEKLKQKPKFSLYLVNPKVVA